MELAGRNSRSNKKVNVSQNAIDESSGQFGLNSSYDERANGCVFAEKFRDREAVQLNSGSIIGTPAVDNGAVLNGTTDYIKYIDTGLLQGNPSNFSIYCKYNKTAVNTGYDFLTMMGATGSLANLSLTFPSDTAVAFSGGNATADVNATVGSNLGSHELLITYSATERILYYDGVEVAKKTGSLTWNIASSDFSVGSSTSGSSLSSVSVEGLCIYNTTLTAKAAQELNDYGHFKNPMTGLTS